MAAENNNPHLPSRFLQQASNDKTVPAVIALAGNN